MAQLTIGRLARLGGVNLETIRYYERRGLLPKPTRTAAGYRQFSPESARRLRFIRRAQALGFSLDEIRDLLALHSAPQPNRSSIRAHAKAKVEDIKRKIADLHAMRRTLEQLVSRCEHCEPSIECPIIASLDEESEQ